MRALKTFAMLELEAARDRQSKPHHEQHDARERERREAIEGVLEAHVGAAIEQDLHDLEVPVVAGVEERRRAVAELGVDVDPLVEELFHRRGVSLAGRVLELLRLGRRRCLREREDGGERDQKFHDVSLMTPDASRRIRPSGNSTGTAQVALSATV
jgi:hypothetical protein